MNFYYESGRLIASPTVEFVRTYATRPSSAPITAKNSTHVKHNLIIQKTHSLLLIVAVVGKEAGEVKLK